MIARCRGVADAVCAVKFARVNDLLVAVRGGGHNVGGRAVCDHGIVIDLSAMRGVFVDADRRTVRVQGGATLGDVDRETHLHGLAVPAGVVSRTGIAGLTLGGGVGWLARKYGLTCDNVLSFEVVTADAAVVTADAEHHPDLFWALRGGGGNFGVVTSFLYQAHPVATVLGGLIPPRSGRPGDPPLSRLHDLGSGRADCLRRAALHTGRGTGRRRHRLLLRRSGRGARVLQPLRAFGTPLADTIQPLPFPAMQSILDGAFPDGTFNYWKSTFLTGLTDEAIAIMVEHANRVGSPLSAVVIEMYGGAASRVGPGDTAFAQRQAEYDIGIMAQWTDSADADRHIAWARGLYDALKPYSSGSYLLNFLAEESPDTIRAAFGRNYPRLVEIKNKYDPTNFFSLNQNVRPSV